jgi:hypothetical protein
MMLAWLRLDYTIAKPSNKLLAGAIISLKFAKTRQLARIIRTWCRDHPAQEQSIPDLKVFPP